MIVRGSIERGNRIHQTAVVKSRRERKRGEEYFQRVLGALGARFR